MNSRKLIAFDSDDTIVYHERHGSSIRDSSIRAVRLLQENGHVVALSTGRPAAFSRDVMEAIGIDSGVFVNGNSIVGPAARLARTISIPTTCGLSAGGFRSGRLRYSRSIWIT